MDMMQKDNGVDPQPNTNPSRLHGKEAYGYTGGQGSPTPGETASPKSCSQQSPSLPASGLTERNGIGSTRWDMASREPQDLPAVRDLAPFTSAPQRQYVGVRVKMPVRELLRNIRLSKGTDPMETSIKTTIKATSGRAGKKKRTYSEKQHKQNRQDTWTAVKSMEDLDILVEVLQEDLDKSQSKATSAVSKPFPKGLSPEFQTPWWERDSSPKPDANWLESSWNSNKSHPHCSFSDSGTLSLANAESPCRAGQHPLDSTPKLLSSCMEEVRPKQGHAAFVHPKRKRQGFAREVRPGYHNLPGQTGSQPQDGDAAALGSEGWLKPASSSFAGQDASAVSFFQFQLRREQSWLSSIPADKLLAPDRTGNRLLHKAVAQGKRALAYALALRVASLDQIDEKDAASQTALHIAAEKNHHLIVHDLISLGANINERDGSGKTPLHLCAENGYPKVLEVLRNLQKGGLHVDVDATDYRGLTPLQCAVSAHHTIMTELETKGIPTEAHKFLNLRKEQILKGINCLLEMAADPWLQGTKPSSQAPSYFARIQKDEGPRSRPQRQEEPSAFFGPDGSALPYLEGQDSESPLVSLSSFFGHLPDGTF